MKQCQQCGTQVGDNYRICPKCSSKNFKAVGAQPVGRQPLQKISPARPALPKRKLLHPVMQVALLSRWSLAAIFSGIALFVVLMFTGSGWLADIAARNTSIEHERTVGEEFLVSGQGRGIISAALPNEHPTGQLVNRIGQDLLRAQPDPVGFDYTFLVVQSDVVNAFALPGGFVIVFTGLIEAMGSPEKLAAVIAHEIQHVEHRHGLRNQYRSIGTAALVGMIFGIVQDKGLVFTGELINLKYSRIFEAEADLEGAKLLARAGLSPKVMVEMLDILGQEESGWSPTIFNEHPSTARRSRQVAALPETQMNLPSRIPAWNK
jgi:beta-barrel assembly-enhancing protease